MTRFAEIDESGTVLRVIVAEQWFVDKTPGIWVQCSYNTSGGVHRLGGTPMRFNYPGIGYKYDAARDAFIAPKPFPSWLLDEQTCEWKAPIKMPTNGMQAWDEKTQAWIGVTRA